MDQTEKKKKGKTDMPLMVIKKCTRDRGRGRNAELEGTKIP